MADHHDAETQQGQSCALTRPETRADEAAPRIAHSMPFVAQLIANAHETSTPYRRRKSDRVGPLRAYAALDALPSGGTRRVV